MPSATVPVRLVVPALFLALACAGCSKEPSEEQKQADFLLAKAKTIFARNEYRAARVLLDSCIILDQNLNRPSKVAEEEWLLGGLFSVIGDFDSTLLSYGRAAEGYRNLADRQSVRDVTLDIAAAYRRMGEERKAFELYTEALRLANVFKDERGATTIQWEMLASAVALDARDDEKQLIATLTAAAKASKDTRQLARIHYESGLAEFLRGEFAQARQDLSRASALADNAKDSVLAATAVLRLAMTCNAAGMSRECFQAYSEGLQRADKLRGGQPLRYEMLTRIGNVYLSMRRYVDAAKFYRAALGAAIASGNKIGEGYCVVQLGHCDLDRAHDSAVKSYKAALDLFQSCGYAPGASYALLCLGNAAKRTGRFTDATSSMLAAIDLSETFHSARHSDDLTVECEQAFFGPRRHPCYDELIEVFLQTGKYDEAFRVAERRNARELWDFLGCLAPVTAAPEVNEGITHLSAERASLIGAEQQLVRFLTAVPPQKETLGDLRQVLARKTESYARAGDDLIARRKGMTPFVRPGSFSLADAQRQLPAGTVLAEEVATSRALYTFTLTTARSAVQVAAVSRDSVAAMTREFAGLLRRREQQSDTLQPVIRQVERRIQDLDAVLYEIFVRPIEGEMAGASRIICVLPAEAASLPLHALRRNAASPYLAEQVLVSYLPSAWSLLLTPAAQAPARDVVGVGFPGETSWDVEYELRDIRAFFKQARLYFGQQATLGTLQGEHADVVDIAAVLHPDWSSPGNSSVTLSNGESPDGMKRVPLGELFSLPAFPVVIFSDLGDARLGIGRAEPYPFLANGTRMVVMDDYVPSRKTKKYFGEVFYTALQNGDVDLEAFRKAQLAMIKNPEFAAPYVWAPFFDWGK